MVKDDDPVSDKLCIARRDALLEKIDGLKKAIYVSGASITAIIVIVQLLLTLWK